MTLRLAVLGGSSPFTIELFRAMSDVSTQLPVVSCLLLGRDQVHGEAVADCARSMVSKHGWAVEHTTQIDVCLEGADLVIHQIRYGGMEGRRKDEELCAGLGVRFDETLGAGALSALLRTSRELPPIGRALSRCSSNAWVINLTNPLSAVTTILRRAYSLPRCLGACELPVHTAGMIAQQLGTTLDDLDWAYTGLNHRGFIHHLTVEGRDVLPDFLEASSSDFLGIPRASIAALKAVPLKYLRLLFDAAPVHPEGRAGYLIELSERIFAEIRSSRAALPPSIAGREMPWYSEAVVPLMLALIEGDATELVASVPDDATVAWERRIVIEAGRVAAAAQPPPPEEVEAFMRPLVAHEEALVHAALEPSPQTIRRAIELDPLVPEERASECTEALVQRWAC